MNPDLIFAPMGVMALLTFAVLALIPIRRFRAAGSGAVEAEDFRYGESGRVPGAVSIPNRNYMNLLELPTLFYPVCLMAYVAHRVDLALLVAAWLFVAARVAHSLIHLTYHRIMHRLAAFAIGNIALGAMWVIFFLRL